MTLVPPATGRITNHGQPAQFANIQILNADAPFDQPVGFTGTGFDGTYRIAVLPGTYKMKVSFSGGISQYAHQKTNLADAERFTVAEGEEVVVDEAAVTPSTLHGRLTNADGTPAMGAFVGIRSGQQFFGALVGPDGEWSATVLPGTYTVAFSTQLGTQFAFGKTSEATADLISVESGASAEVNDVLRPPGSVTFTATDRKTGSPVTNFCITLGNISECTTTGSQTVSVLAGHYFGNIYTPDQTYVGELIQVDVVSGQDTPVAVKLAKAATFTTVARDAETGAPVEGACVQLVSPVDPTSLVSFGGFCSGPDGPSRCPALDRAPTTHS
jgi:hypothetical protein